MGMPDPCLCQPASADLQSASLSGPRCIEPSCVVVVGSFFWTTTDGVSTLWLVARRPCVPSASDSEMMTRNEKQHMRHSTFPCVGVVWSASAGLQKCRPVSGLMAWGLLVEGWMHGAD